MSRLPAAVDGSRSGQPITVHFSTTRGDHVWVVELRPTTTATGHLPDIRAGERIDLPDGAALVVSSSYPEGGVTGSWLWTSRLAIVKCNEFAVVRDGSRTRSLPASIATWCTVETGSFRVSGDPES